MKTPPQRRKLQTEVQMLRGRQRAAVDESLAVSDDDGNATEEDLPHRGRPPKNLSGAHRDMQSPRSSRQSSLSPGKYLTPTKRRKRELQLGAAAETGTAAGAVSTTQQPLQKIQAESFVMKLFDRSLDLSKYTEQTALYPICRAWMANQPRNPSIRSYREKRSPSPVEREKIGTELLSKLRRGEVREVKAMPAPQGAALSKIPTIKKYSTQEQDLKKLDDILINNINSSELKSYEDKEDLLTKHLGKWKQIKINWMKQSRSCQKRYELNHLILQELFKP